jgi:hypothetical protein
MPHETALDRMHYEAAKRASNDQEEASLHENRGLDVCMVSVEIPNKFENLQSDTNQCSSDTFAYAYQYPCDTATHGGRMLRKPNNTNFNANYSGRKRFKPDPTNYKYTMPPYTNLRRQDRKQLPVPTNKVSELRRKEIKEETRSPQKPYKLFQDRVTDKPEQNQKSKRMNKTRSLNVYHTSQRSPNREKFSSKQFGNPFTLSRFNQQDIAEKYIKHARPNRARYYSTDEWTKVKPKMSRQRRIQYNSLRYTGSKQFRTMQAPSSSRDKHDARRYRTPGDPLYVRPNGQLPTKVLSHTRTKPQKRSCHQKPKQEESTKIVIVKLPLCTHNCGRDPFKGIKPSDQARI